MDVKSFFGGVSGFPFTEGERLPFGLSGDSFARGDWDIDAASFVAGSRCIGFSSGGLVSCVTGFVNGTGSSSSSGALLAAVSCTDTCGREDGLELGVLALGLEMPAPSSEESPPSDCDLIKPPIGGERMKLAVVTSLKSLGFPRSTLPRCCFALLSSLIQLGCWAGAAFGLGDSGLLMAFSSQLDFVGLHRLLGLAGGPFSSCVSSSITPWSSEKELTSLRSGGAVLPKLSLD